MFAEDLKHIALRLLKALNTPESQVVIDHIKAGRWDQIATTKFDPLLHHDKSVDQFRRICLSQEFLRKAEFLETSIDRDQVARDNFLACEAQCFKANLHLEKYITNQVLSSPVDIAFYEILLRAKAWLKQKLGPVPQVLNGRFGPGATFESKAWKSRRLMTSYDKLRNMPCATTEISELMVDHLVWQTAFSIAWSSACPTRLLPRVRGNRFVTVPKDATTFRGIAIEPGVNMLGQLAVGDYLKLRLKRVGIDLRGTEDRKHPVLDRLGLSLGRPWKGQLLHREMARESSVSGTHATIDLKNASDTICRSLVKLLLPSEWYDLLNELRSHFTSFSFKKGGAEAWVHLEKFSSMGNGFTFELETLIFASLAQAVGAKVGTDTFVYGDDLIVPDALADDLLAVLRYVGMTPNLSKTFKGSECGFRESCGGDYLLGHDVRPFYIKEKINAPEHWISLANNLRYWSIKWSMPELMAVRASVLDQIPAAIRRCRGPEELGDLVIHDEVAKWNTTNRGSIRYIRVWRPVRRIVKLKSVRTESHSIFCRPWRDDIVEQDVALTAALIGLPSQGLTPRGAASKPAGKTAGYRFGFVAFS